jgi:hypothetical protein
MHEYRVTKYDPEWRNSRGAYIKAEWTMFTDIGQAFGGVVLTNSEYERVEGAYVESAIAFLRESGITELTIGGLENHKKRDLEFGEGSTLPLNRIGDVIRSLLREEFWCRLESNSGFVHVGWDYYMYIGVLHPCPSAERRAKELGLYVEDFESPYRDND